MAEIVRYAFTTIQDMFDHGDPVARKMFFVDGYFWQIFLPIFFVFFVKVLGPALMKNRQPFKLDPLLVVYNFAIVFLYLTFMAGMVYLTFRYNLFPLLCKNAEVIPNTPEYYQLRCMHGIYLLKYVEFFDTISFVLRKKFRSITNLHLIHHAAFPGVFWFLFRSEFTGYQAMPCFINSGVHALMYFYYGVAAMGPRFRWFLWWKKYLTLMQMAQFVGVIFLGLLAYFGGCEAAHQGIFLSIAFAALMLVLFSRFYIMSYLRPAKDKPEAVNEKVEKSD